METLASRQRRTEWVSLKLTAEDYDGYTVIEISGRMDQDAVELREIIGRKVEAGVLSIIVEMNGVRLTNSIGLGMLVEAYKAAVAGGAKFVLAGVQPQVRTVLAHTKLDTIFRICDSLEDAIAVVSE